MITLTSLTRYDMSPDSLIICVRLLVGSQKHT